MGRATGVLFTKSLIGMGKFPQPTVVYAKPVMLN
tara:strand:+ start:14303 stop:14404 length:102 start_codon:yes stop_codon:yes gene_type:complete